MNKKAVVLSSGGLDSTTCLALAKSQGFECHVLTFDYGQKNRAEIAAAKEIAHLFDAKTHKILRIPVGELLLGSALTDLTIDVPNYCGDGQIPATYVPARNTIFLSVALGLAETLKANDIFIGVSSVDYSGYPDCRPEYFDAFRQLATLATKAGVNQEALHIHTPLIYLSKADTIRLGTKLDVDYQFTVTCYRADEKGFACGTCDSCTLRKQGFARAGIADPTRYY